MIIAYLIAMCAISVVNACILSFFYRRRLNSYFTAIFFAIIVANFGHLFVALSQTLEGVIVANKVCYLGACFLPMFVFFVVLRLCNFNFPIWGKILLGMVNAVLFGLSCTVGESDIYYESVRYVVSSGVGSYVATYGPAHVLWDIMLVGYTCATVAIIVYAGVNERNVSYKNLIALAVLEFITIAAFIVSRQIENDMLIMPLVYVLNEVVLLYVCVQIKMYDISNSVLESLEAENICAYVAFSTKGSYLGCNDIATKFFPDLLTYRVDHMLPEEGEIARVFRGWIKDLAEGRGSKYNQFVYNNRHFKSSLKEVRNKKRSQIYLFGIEDETRLQRYIEHLGAKNNKLENVVKNNASHIHAIQEQMIVGMAKMVESRDSNTGGHIMRTSEVATILAHEIQKDESLSYSKDFFDALVAAAPMHDLGKIAIDDQILRKPGRFTPEEFEVMKTHAEKGCAIVENLLSEIEKPFFVEIAKNVACYHHERWNGEGYPRGLKGEEIPFEARIMAIADVYDALVSHRCYKDCMSFGEAYSIIIGSMGSHFDPGLKRHFINCRGKLESYYKSVEH